MADIDINESSNINNDLNSSKSSGSSGSSNGGDGSLNSSSLEGSSNLDQSTTLDVSIDHSNKDVNLEKIDLSDNENKEKTFETDEGNGNNNGKKVIYKTKIYIIEYFKKWKGTGKDKRPPLPDIEEIGWSWLTSFISILVLGFIHYREAIDAQMQVLIGSFAASAVILFAIPKSPLAQPRNLILGHFLSAIVGSIIRVALVYTNANFEVACALAVSLSITVMQFTNSLHPPGGATALICVMGAEQRWRGFYFIFLPVTSGAFIMLATALVVNNLARKRSYPLYWW